MFILDANLQYVLLNLHFKPPVQTFRENVRFFFFTWSPHVNAQQFILLYVQQHVSFPVLVNVAKFRRLFYENIFRPNVIFVRIDAP